MQKFNEDSKEEQRNIRKISRCIELLENRFDDNYKERCGYDSNKVEILFEPCKDRKDMSRMRSFYDGVEDGPEFERVLKEAEELQKREQVELYLILFTESDNWWI